MEDFEVDGTTLMTGPCGSKLTTNVRAARHRIVRCRVTDPENE